MIHQFRRVYLKPLRIVPGAGFEPATFRTLPQCVTSLRMSQERAFLNYLYETGLVSVRRYNQASRRGSEDNLLMHRLLATPAL